MNRRQFLGGTLSTLSVPLTTSACGGDATKSAETPVILDPSEPAVITPVPSSPSPAPTPTPTLKIAMAGSSSSAEYLSEYIGPESSQLVRVTKDGLNFTTLREGAFGKVAGQAIHRATNRSVDYIDAGAKGTTLRQWAIKNSIYRMNLIKLIRSCGGVDVVLLQVGRNDAAFGLVSSRQDQRDMIESIVADVRLSCNIPNLLFVLGASQNIGGGNVTIQELLALQRLAELDAAASLSQVWYGFSTYDLPTRDGIHQTEESQILSGTRFAEQIVSYVNKTIPPRGPRGTSTSRIDTTSLDLFLDTSRGIEFGPSLNISGFFVRNEEGLLPATANRTGPSTVRIKHRALTTASYEIRYALDADLDAQTCLRDTSSVCRPMEPLLINI